jgi:hypothetical protein
MNENTELLIQDINALQAQLGHRSFHPESTQYILFKEKLQNQLDKMRLSYPDIDWGKEMERVGKM